MGELHIEITTYRIVNDHKVDVVVSKPIVVYRECVEHEAARSRKVPQQAQQVLPQGGAAGRGVIKAILDGEIPSDTKIKDQKALAKKLQDLGFDKEESKSVVSIHGTDILWT